MRKKLAMSALFLVAAVGLAACSDGPYTGVNTTNSTTPPAKTLTSAAWDLTTYRGPAGRLVDAAATATLAFEAHGTLAGSTGCNQFSGTYTTSGDAITITPGPVTLIACTDAAVAAQESALLTLLDQVTTYRVTSDTLTLRGTGGGTLLSYDAGLSGLSGTSWAATGVNNGNGAVESTTATEQLTATFGPDGDFSGFGGCNTLRGTYQLVGTDGLTITGLTSTQKACSPEVDALESQYTTALGKVTDYSLAGSQLTLRDGDGATQVSYRLQG